ncbi:Putative glycosyltransferase EpsF [Rubripirellula lacrimiformis]|uniref:Glycosyltransferase EpsF n=1 Tax=Rubripirellula lacrimiformis TaxID=1930273 RepID=A0A517NGN0_9BACT|nr:glycosyltransferase [Rubripirellula lacrimiformis]QDT06289.1 Putative glycosyltransferase EpsF [Rubripirellula lacrimiformis]
MGIKRIHVVLVVLRLDVGGMERYIANLANGLSRDRFRVSVICLDGIGAARRWITADDVELIELGLRSGNSWHAVTAITDVLQRLQPDIVHSHNWATLLETYFGARRYGEAIHVHGERGTVLGSNSCGPLKRKIRAATMRWACRRIALTTNAYCVAKKVTAITRSDLSRIHVIPNGLDPRYPNDQLPEMRASTRQSLGISRDELVFGSVARLSTVKNLELAIRALAAARPTISEPVHLVLVGDGPCLAELEQLAMAHVDAVTVHLPGHQWDPWPYLAAMDVFVNCSHSEGMSQSMIEAMAAGLPVIATDVGDAFEMISRPDAAGIVVAPNDELALTHAMITMANASMRRSYAAYAMTRQRDVYCLRTMVQGYEEMYTTIATKS